jgi:hypothetical protein
MYNKLFIFPLPYHDHYQFNDLRRQQSSVFIVATNRYALYLFSSILSTTIEHNLCWWCKHSTHRLRSFDAAVTRPGMFICMRLYMFDARDVVKGYILFYRIIVS